MTFHAFLPVVLIESARWGWRASQISSSLSPLFRVETNRSVSFFRLTPLAGVPSLVVSPSQSPNQLTPSFLLSQEFLSFARVPD